MKFDRGSALVREKEDCYPSILNVETYSKHSNAHQSIVDFTTILKSSTCHLLIQEKFQPPLESDSIFRIVF